jgi:hypothetical protein
VAAKDAGQLTEFDRLTLHQAVTVVALELLRRRVADDTERRLAGDVLAAMVSGDLEGTELARRLEPFGLGERVGVMVLQPPRPVRKAVDEALTNAVRDEAPGGLVAGTGPFSCALLPQPRRGEAGDEDALFGLAERVRMRVVAGSGEVLTAGVGRAGRRRRAAARLPRGPLRARGAGARRPGQRRRRRVGDIPRPRLLPAPAGAPGRRRAAGCSATRSSRRSRTARAPTAAS